MTLILRFFAGLIDIGFIGALAAGWFYVLQHALGAKLPPRYWNYWDYLVDLINLHPKFLWLALLSTVLGAVVYLVSGVFLHGSLGLFLTGLELSPFKRGFKAYILLFIRFLLFILGLPLAGISLSGIIWTGGRAGPHDWLTGVKVDRRNSEWSFDEEGELWHEE